LAITATEITGHEQQTQQHPRAKAAPSKQITHKSYDKCRWSTANGIIACHFSSAEFDSGTKGWPRGTEIDDG